MSAWRIDQTYGFGAAGVRLCPDPVGSGRGSPSLGSALAGLASDLRARGFLGSLGAGLRLLPGLALGLTLALALFQTASREPVDASDLHVVRFEPVPQRLAPPPLPTPEPLPEPEELLPPAVAEREPPAPPTPELEQPAPPAPPRPHRALPSIASIASIAPPPPPPALPATEPVRPEAPPPTRPRPDVRIDSLARAPAPPPPPSAPRVPRPAAEPAPPRPGFALAMPAAPLPAAGRSAPPPQLSSRAAAPRPEPGTRSARPGRLALAPLPGVGAAAPGGTGAPGDSGRVSRETPAAAPPRAEASEPRLRGVPLGSLAACVSDRREDELKLRLMAERGDAGECASAAGHYRFVETRNLNAFLIWVERAPSRRAADRCVELSLALECLAQKRGRSRET